MSKKLSFFYLIGLFTLTSFFIVFTTCMLVTDLYKSVGSYKSFNIPFIFAIILVVLTFVYYKFGFKNKNKFALSLDVITNVFVRAFFAYIINYFAQQTWAKILYGNETIQLFELSNTSILGFFTIYPIYFNVMFLIYHYLSFTKHFNTVNNKKVLSLKATNIYLIVLLAFIILYYAFTLIHFAGHKLGIEFTDPYAIDYISWSFGGVHLVFVIPPILFITIYGNKNLNVKFKIIDGVTFGLSFYLILRALIYYASTSEGAFSHITDDFIIPEYTRSITGTIAIPFLIVGLGIIAFHFFNLYYLKNRTNE